MAKRENLTVKAMQMYQDTEDNYGKNRASDTIAIATNLETATITAMGTGKQLKNGDIIKVFPVLVSGDGATAVAGETLVFDVTHYVAKHGYKKDTISVNFTGTTVDDITTALTTAGLNTYVKAELVGTKLRLQALVEDTSFIITGGTGLASLKLSVGDYAIHKIFKVSSNVAITDTSVNISEFYSYGIDKLDTVASLSGLNYVCERFLGEATGATLSVSLTEDTYKGSSKVAVQTEYGEGDSTLSVDELVFNVDNLDYIKGFKKRTTSRTFFSGKSCSATYKYGSYCNPVEFHLRGYAPKSDNIGLLCIDAERVKSPSTTITLGKEFRTMNETMNILANTDRVVAKIYEL